MENPTNSYMWLTKWFRKLLCRGSFREVRFQNCMRGGTRDKKSSWWTNVAELSVLAVMCDGSHEHEAWGAAKCKDVWSVNTEKEAEYPDLLCQRAADAIKTLQKTEESRS